VLAVVLAILASGASPQSVEVEVEGDCPSRAAVEEALAPLVAASSSTASTTRIVIRDRGATYEVAGGEIARVVADADRRCSDRAHAAAVIAMLAIAPPLVPLEESTPADALHDPKSVAAERSEVQSIVPLSSGSRRTIDLEAQLVAGPSGAGGGVRGALQGEMLGVSIGARATSPSHRIVSSGASASIQRSQADIGVRLQGGLRPLDLAIDVGAALSVLVIAGENLPVTRGATRLEPGVRAAASARLWVLDPIALTLAAEVSFTPWPTPIVIDPLGRVGNSGATGVWGSAGVLVRLD
jgi:hypothetical protein